MNTVFTFLDIAKKFDDTYGKKMRVKYGELFWFFHRIRFSEQPELDFCVMDEWVDPPFADWTNDPLDD